MTTETQQKNKWQDTK